MSAPKVRCRWHVVVTATDLDRDPWSALRPAIAYMPDRADVVLEIAGTLSYVDGNAVARILGDAEPRTVEVWAHGPGVRYLMDALRGLERSE